LKPYGYPILVKDYAITYGLRGIDVLEVIKLEKKEQMRKRGIRSPDLADAFALTFSYPVSSNSLARRKINVKSGGRTMQQMKRR